MADTAAIEARTRTAVEAYVKAWGSNDRAALLNLFAEDGTWVDPVGSTPCVGRAQIATFWDNAHGGGTKLEPQIQRIIVCGNEAILLFRMVVRTADGGGMGVNACDHMVVNDEGRIQTGEAFWDPSCIVPLEQC